MGRWGEVEIINKCLRKNQGASIFMDTPLQNQLVLRPNDFFARGVICQ